MIGRVDLSDAEYGKFNHTPTSAACRMNFRTAKQVPFFYFYFYFPEAMTA
jgi:hypothetical protein